MAFLRGSLPIICIGLLCFALLALSDWSIDPRLRAKNAQFEAQLAHIQARVAQFKSTAITLRDEVDRLKNDPNEIVYHARNGLGMVRPGEVIYRFEPSDQAPLGEPR